MKNGLQKALDHLRYSLMPTGLSDAQLLNSFIAQRDEAAFAALVRKHGPMVMGVCRRILRNAHDTDDAFQATFLVLVQKVRSLANRQALASWLYTVAYRTALEARARNLRRQQRERQVDVPHPEARATEAADWQPILDQELNRLPEKYRTPVILCELEGRPRKEVARQLGLAEGTLSSRLATARRMLAKKLAQHGITLSGGALAVAISEVSACVPPSLVLSTVKAALVVAAGQVGALMTPAAILSQGVIKAMFIAKLKTTVATVFAVLLLGTGGLVYCAGGGGQAVQSQERALNPLEALRKENELLKINLRVTLEKIQAMEVELKRLKGQAQVDRLSLNPDAALEKWLRVELLNNGVDRAIGRPESAVNKDVIINKEVIIRKQSDPRPDPTLQLEGMLKTLRDARDERSRKMALDQMENALKRLREQHQRPASEPAPEKLK
jgi:RNA polymerase sigma factor (sigma-70 family)